MRPYKQYEQNKQDTGYGKYIAYIVVIGLLIWLIPNCFAIVPVGHKGILLEWGAVTGNPLGEGLHLKVPLMHMIKIMDVKTQKYEGDADSASKDLQSIISTVATNYHIDPLMVNVIYQTIGDNYRGKIIAPAIEESVKAATAKFTAEELITKREDVKVMMKLELTKKLSPYNIIVETVSIVNFKFSSGFDAAIELKVKAEQDALTAQRRLEQIKFEAQQAMMKASGEANATIMNAEAEATALRIQGEALRDNPEIKELRAIEKWNGILPIYMLGEGTVPFIQIPTGDNNG